MPFKQITTIRINFDVFDEVGRGKNIKSVVFADDGCSMNANVLQRYLKLGWSNRYNDERSIGRFGVGMTLGAIHECGEVEVFSKDFGWRVAVYLFGFR